MFTLRDIPRYETIRAMSKRYSDADPSAIEAFLVLLRVATDLMNAGESYLGRHGFSVGRFMVLMLLNRNPEVGVSPSQLADMAGVTRATMTGLVDSLERDGFVTREHDPLDRRSVTIHLTERAHEFLHGFLPRHFRRIAGVMANLSANEKKKLVTLLSKVSEGITALNDE